MKIRNAGKMWVFVAAIAALVLNGCSRGTGAGFGSEKPYVDLQDLTNRGVPTNGFLRTSFEMGSDNTIELRLNTFGRPEDQKSIDPTMEGVKYLMQNLRKQHPIHVVVIDGDPSVATTQGGKPQGTGKPIWEVTFPVSP
jgi:hypothetical protein